MSSDSIIECVPNFSEGHDPALVRQIVSAMEVDGVRLLDYSLDADHNRSVVTIAGVPSQVMEAAVRAAGRAAELIDLTRQSGVHPRIGAADVIPFVPVSGVSIAEAALLARHAGLQIWRRYGIPVYFYSWRMCGEGSLRVYAKLLSRMALGARILVAPNSIPPPEQVRSELEAF
jgi:glutamate formiminotransferase